MSTFVLTLSDPLATLENVGGKGLSLVKLTRAGLPVPDGFQVTTDAYRRFVSDNGIQPRILEALEGIDPTDPITLEPVSRLIGGFFAEGTIPAEIADAVTAAYQTLNDVPVAVRSSATAEDLPGASFAGQQETYLNIRGADALLEAVKKCWASLWTARAVTYRARQGIDPDSVALAVVVQELVSADASGVMFTANPINGKRDEIMITAAWGLGEAIVSGVVTPDTITIDKATSRLIRRETAEKQVMTVRAETGTRDISVPDSQKKIAVLTDSQATELARLGADIEKLYAMPMDIEWTLTSPPSSLLKEKGGFAIVQARPITALPPEPVQWNLPKPKMILARGSLCEHLPNPVSPLFGTLGVRMVNIPTAEVGVLALGSGGGDYQYRVVNGYVYLGVEFGLKETLGMAKFAVTQMRKMLLKSHQYWQDARQNLAEVIEKWDKKNVEDLSPSKLLEGVRELMVAAGKYYTVIQASTLPSATASEEIFTRVYKTVSRKDESKAETLLFGLETAPLRAEKSLFDLGLWIRENPALRDFTLHTSTDDLLTALGAEPSPDGIPAQDWEALKTHLEKHLDEFGHTSFEFDFMNPTPTEMPGMILNAVKIYIEGKGCDPYARQRGAVERREQTVKKIQRRFKLVPNRWFNKALKWAMDAGPEREDSLADLGMGHITIRRLLSELGRRFVAGRAIAKSEDIYWLVEDEVNELTAMLERGDTLPDYSARVPERKATWQAQMKLTPPAMLPETSRWAKMMPWARENTSGDILKGLGASAGKVTATACVMFAPEDFGRMKPGNVLVAVTTTPAWTPLFTMASAVVTDIGGPLSHSSIVAREYGIPAVLATGIGTRRIRDGQTITVDGGAGTVALK